MQNGISAFFRFSREPRKTLVGAGENMGHIVPQSSFSTSESGDSSYGTRATTHRVFPSETSQDIKQARSKTSSEKQERAVLKA